jgi:hypothetical protein
LPDPPDVVLVALCSVAETRAAEDTARPPTIADPAAWRIARRGRFTSRVFGSWFIVFLL